MDLGPGIPKHSADKRYVGAQMPHELVDAIDAYAADHYLDRSAALKHLTAEALRSRGYLATKTNNLD